MQFRPGSSRLLGQHRPVCRLFSFTIDMNARHLDVSFTNAWGSIMYFMLATLQCYPPGEASAQTLERRGIAYSESLDELFVGNYAKD